MTIRDLIDESYNNAVDKGFFDRELSQNDLLMQIVSEVGEAYEAIRKGESLERIAEEMADILISCCTAIGDMEKTYGFDGFLELTHKQACNRARPYLHGKRF